VGEIQIEILGCESCGAPDAEVAAATQFDWTCELIDESHFSVFIGECERCHQRWISVFSEDIDWVGGDDAQYTRRLPITLAESNELQAQGNKISLDRLQEIGLNRRYLQIDHPTGKPKRICWTLGHLSVWRPDY
jgi:hypothetical protein